MKPIDILAINLKYFVHFLLNFLFIGDCIVMSLDSL